MRKCYRPDLWIILFCIGISSLNCKQGRPTPHLRPKIHYTASKNWINDPNGLIAFKGKYHMYYQYNPFGNDWGHMSWGHAVSTDLYQWNEKAVALPETGFLLYPHMKFSGSTVIDSENTSGLCNGVRTCLIAVYTEWTLLNQKQNIAVSHDEGETFREYAHNPVISGTSWSFRDPKVFWHKETSQWIMVVARPSAQKIEIYSSLNLREWHKQSEFKQELAEPGIWECPDLFFLKDEQNAGKGKWVLLLSVAETPKGSFMKYFLGDFNGKIYKPDDTFKNGKILDHGFDFYAAISWENSTDRIIVGWMNNWEYPNDIPTFPWKGTMSLPRNLSLKKEKGRYALFQNPVPGFEKHARKMHAKNSMQLNDTSYAIPLSGNSFVFTASFKNTSAHEVGLKLKNHNESILICFQNKDNTMQVSRQNMSSFEGDKNFRRLSLSKAIIEETNNMDFLIIVDNSVIEIFAQNGKTVFSNLIFPQGQFLEMEIFAKKGKTNVSNISLHNSR